MSVIILFHVHTSADSASETFLKSSEDDHIRAFSIIGRLACAKGQPLAMPIFPSDKDLQQYRCSICDVDLGSRRLINILELSDTEELFDAITNLYQMAQKTKYSRPRVAAILTMKRLLSHFENLAYLDISSSSFGRWCLQGLKSSMRDLRVAAG